MTAPWGLNAPRARKLRKTELWKPRALRKNVGAEELKSRMLRRKLLLASLGPAKICTCWEGRGQLISTVFLQVCGAPHRRDLPRTSACCQRKSASAGFSRRESAESFHIWNPWR